MARDDAVSAIFDAHARRVDLSRGAYRRGLMGKGQYARMLPYYRRDRT